MESGDTQAPPHRYRGRAFRRGLPLWVVETQEVDAPEGVDPLHWVLWSLEPVEDEEDARVIRRVYKARWGGEDFLKVSKSGCQLEAQHVSDLSSFKRLLAVVMATATQLTQLVTLAREEPSRPARELVEEEAYEATRDACGYHRVQWPRGKISLGRFVELVARVGGYEPRKDRQPGWLVLYRGWTRIQEHHAIVEHERKEARRRSKSFRKRA